MTVMKAISITRYLSSLVDFCLSCRTVHIYIIGDSAFEHILKLSNVLLQRRKEIECGNTLSDIFGTVTSERLWWLTCKRNARAFYRCLLAIFSCQIWYSYNCVENFSRSWGSHIPALLIGVSSLLLGYMAYSSAIRDRAESVKINFVQDWKCRWRLLFCFQQLSNTESPWRLGYDGFDFTKVHLYITAPKSIAG